MKHVNDIVVGMLFGDEGKGTVVDYLAKTKNPYAVVRFSGGGQAEHNVVTPSGEHHTFSSFGSGAFHEVPTILSRFMMVNPYSLVAEGDSLSETVGWNVFEQLMISENSLLTTPIHVVLNRLREKARGDGRHGSCGVGIGETTLFNIRFPHLAPVMGDLKDLGVLEQKMCELFEYACSEVGESEELSDVKQRLPQILGDYKMMVEDNIFSGVVSDDTISSHLGEGYIIFEGSQGVLLDEKLGFHPHTTWSCTTQRNAQTLLSDAGLSEGNTIGVVRKYLTRHGDGPLPGEFTNSLLDDGRNVCDVFPETHNGWGEFQGGWRVAPFNFPLFDYAVRANGGVDEVAVTHMDVKYDKFVEQNSKFPYIPSTFFGGDRDRQAVVTTDLVNSDDGVKVWGSGGESFVEKLETFAPVKLLSYGKTWEDKKVR